MVVGFGCEPIGGWVGFGRGVVLGFEIDEQVNYCLVVNSGIW